ncbi:MAG: hypothetical protein KDB79_05520 [Acidobacteria bacterium]|nr:hypothetical protein [Acidobacteriota bacterium]
MEPLGGHQLDINAGRRSRKWIIIVIVLVVILPIFLTFGIFAVVFGGLYYGTKNTEEFKCAMSEVRKNKDAVELLGEPINDGYFVMPSIEISGPVRRVNFSVPVTGSKSSATLEVNSFRDGFNSNFMMSLRGDGGKKLLLHRGSYPCGSE